MTIRKMLFASTAFTLVLLMALLAAVTLGFNHTKAAVQNEQQVTQRARVAILDARYDIVQIQQYLTDMSATGDRTDIPVAVRYRDEALKNLRLLAGLMPQRASQIDTIAPLVREVYKVGLHMAETYVTRGETAGNAEMQEPGTGFDARTDVLTKKMDALQKDVVAEMHASVKETNDTMNNARLVSLLLGLAIAVLLLGSGIMLARILLRRLGGEPGYVSSVVERVASGDLTVEIQLSPKDTGSLLFGIKTMIAKLQQVIGEVTSATDALSSASEEVAATAQSLSQGASEQAASIEETGLRWRRTPRTPR